MSFSSQRRNPLVLYENRYCNQDEFNIVICGGFNGNKATNKVTLLKSPDFQTSVNLIPMLNKRCLSKTAVISSDIYVLGGYDVKKTWASTFEMYSRKTNNWKTLKPFRKSIRFFSVCSFMKNLYVNGGLSSDHEKNYRFCTNDCYKYDVEINKWSKVASLQTEREHSACTVFEGKIVVTGGCTDIENLKSVESYDHHENKWTYLSDMVETKFDHSALTIGSKMIVISDTYSKKSEVFDNISRKFSLFNIIPLQRQLRSYLKAFSISNRFIVIANVHSYKPKMYVYNVDESKWVFKDILMMNSFKLPRYSALNKLPKQ